KVAVHPQEAVALLAQVEETLDLGGLAGEVLGVGLVVLAPPAAPPAAAVARLGRIGGLGLLLTLLLLALLLAAALGLLGLLAPGRPAALLAVAVAAGPGGPVAVAGRTATGRGLGRLGGTDLELPLGGRLLVRAAGGRRGGCRGLVGGLPPGLGLRRLGTREPLPLVALRAAVPGRGLGRSGPGGRRLVTPLLPAARRAPAGPGGPRRRG